jgi:predicted DCC family thiol-disulfide oxidoreductase YuxK
MSTMVLVDKGIVYDRSDAVLRIGQSLNLPANGQWAALAARIAVPKPIRDWFYSDVISANRVSTSANFAPDPKPYIASREAQNQRRRASVKLILSLPFPLLRAEKVVWGV